MLAYEFIAKDRAGLTMWAQDEDGELTWVGTGKQHYKAKVLEMQFEESDEFPEPPRSNVEWPL
jgi:hypothetical protein